MLKIGAALLYYKLGKNLLQTGAASLLLIGASVATNWGSYYRSGQPLLQNRAAMTNWGRHYKFGQLVPIRAMTNAFPSKLSLFYNSTLIGKLYSFACKILIFINFT